MLTWLEGALPYVSSIFSCVVPVSHPPPSAPGIQEQLTTSPSPTLISGRVWESVGVLWAESGNFIRAIAAYRCVKVSCWRSCLLPVLLSSSGKWARVLLGSTGTCWGFCTFCCCLYCCITRSLSLGFYSTRELQMYPTVTLTHFCCSTILHSFETHAHVSSSLPTPHAVGLGARVTQACADVQERHRDARCHGAARKPHCAIRAAGTAIAVSCKPSRASLCR